MEKIYKKIFLSLSISFLSEICVSVENRPARMEVFRELLQRQSSDVGNITETLSVDQLENYIHGFLDQLSCTDSRGTENRTQDITAKCNQIICFSTRQLVSLISEDLDAGLNETQFRDISVILLYYIAQIDDFCHTTVDLTNGTMELAYEYLSNQTFGPSGVHALLGVIQPHTSYNHVVGRSKRRRRSVELWDNKRHHRALDDVTGEHTHSVSYLVIQEKCISEDAIYYYMRLENEASLDVGQMATLVIFTLYSGYEIQTKCRLLPDKDAFIDHLFLHFGDGQMINPDGFDVLMENLGIEPASNETSGGHTHERKKRDSRGVTVGQLEGQTTRRKRQAHSEFTECYSATQLLALFDSSEGLDKSHFQALSPALISQKLYGDCTAKAQTFSVSDAEKYGYGTVAIFLICLCSIFGIVFVPCATKRVYDVIMALFLGLAVGTLFADAILHLIPQALGVHDHGTNEHAHHDEAGIVVDDYVTFGLAIMGGLYFFYILEMLMSKLGGHSHNHDEPDPTSGEITSNDHVHKAREENVTPEKKGMTPLAVMIILGDAIHNFADGLAIGAAFTGSVSDGVSTSIAVFCHELPHELGDFAVLLKSGMGFKKALILNFISALTAFIGLYVGIAAASNDVARAWIFAVTAGMFLYIALVDLLPILIRSSSVLALVLNNLGILLGFAIMLIIAIFEEHIKI